MGSLAILKVYPAYSVDEVSRGFFFFFFSSRRRHTRLQGDWSSDVCSSDLVFRMGNSFCIAGAALSGNCWIVPDCDLGVAGSRSSWSSWSEVRGMVRAGCPCLSGLFSFIFSPAPAAPARLSPSDPHFRLTPAITVRSGSDGTFFGALRSKALTLDASTGEGE